MRRAIVAGLLGLILAACGGGGTGNSGGTEPDETDSRVQLRLVIEPAGAAPGAAFLTQPRVEICDASGACVTTDGSTQVTAAIQAGTGTAGAALAGAVTRTASAGVVSFTDLSIDVPGIHYTLTFNAAGLTGASSVDFDVVRPGQGHAPFVPPAPGGEATYYVADSPSASDANDGTSLNTPWRTLQHAADQVQAGDIVEIADGSYGGFELNGVIGTEALPVVFRANGSGALIDRDWVLDVLGSGIVVVDCVHVVMHGLQVQGAPRQGCRILHSNHITIQGCRFTDCAAIGILASFSDYVRIEGNECSGVAASKGISILASSDYGIVRGNYVHGARYAGILCHGDPGSGGDGLIEHTVIESNLVIGISDKGGTAIRLDCARNNIVRNNLIVIAASTWGVYSSDDGFGAAYSSHGNAFLHNTIVSQAIEARECFVLRPGTYLYTIRNNVCVVARQVLFFHPDVLVGLDEDHNVFHSINGWDPFEGWDGHTSREYDLSEWQALGGGSHSVAEAPIFTDPDAMDYSLAPGSPGHDDGQADLGIADTYDGASRPQGEGFDRGCHER